MPAAPRPSCSSTPRRRRRSAWGTGRATLGSGKATFAAAGKVALKLKLTAKARTALKRTHHGLQVSVRVTFTAAGAAPVVKTLKVKLRP